MKRVLSLVTVAAMMAAMMVVAAPAFATIHPLSNSECANASASEVAKGQAPPGISNPDKGNFVQPILSASGGDPFSGENEPKPSPAFKTSGPTVADLDADFCPKPK